MRNVYRGYVRESFKCANFDEFQKVVQSGEVFRFQNYDWYLRNTTFKTDTGYETANIYSFRRVCTTSATTKFTNFYKVEKAENSGLKVYRGEELEKLICDEFRLIIKNLNPKTLRAGTKGLIFYLNAIPSEVYLRDGFAEKLKKTATDSFVRRIKAANDGETIERLYSISKETNKIVDEHFNRGEIEQSETAEKTKAAIEKLKEKKIKDMTKDIK